MQTWIPLDPSCAFAINWFFNKSVTSGRDVFFTCGPLGFLCSTRNVGHNVVIALVFWCAVSLVLALLFWQVIFRVTYSAKWQFALFTPVLRGGSIGTRIGVLFVLRLLFGTGETFVDYIQVEGEKSRVKTVPFQCAEFMLYKRSFRVTVYSKH